jgi:hypothetical protein
VFRAVLVAGLAAVGLPLWMFVAPQVPQPTSINPPSEFYSHLFGAVVDAIQRVQGQLGVWSVFMMYPVFALIGMWIAAPRRPFAAYLTQRRVDFRPQMVRLLVAPEDFNPFVDGELQRRAQILRRPLVAESRELDVEASLVATLEQGGLFTPILARRAIAPEYLVLIERRSPNDHVAKLAETLVAAWRQAQVFVDVYYFNADLRRLTPSPMVPASTFEEVASRCPNHRLIIVSSGEQFFDGASGQLQPWATLVQNYPRRTLLTPDPLALWGYREDALRAELNLAVLPLEPASLPALIEILTTDDPGTLRAQVLSAEMSAQSLALLGELLEDRPIRWVEAGTPDEGPLASLEADLRQALPPAAHDWLVACAVYPELNWKVTVHLGRKLAGSQHSWDSRHLTRLLWLPWFRIGRMPAWLRRRLTDAMPGELYRQIREILSLLLLSGMNNALRSAALSMGLDDRSRTSVIERNVAKQVRDSVLIDFMTRLRVDRTAVKLPHTLARWIAGTGWFRNLLSDAPLNDVSASATILRETVETAGLHLVEIAEEGAPAGKDAASRSAASQGASVGAGLRRVVSFRWATGEVINVPDAYYLYLPAGKQPARLVDTATATLLRVRRGLLSKLAIWHVTLTVLVGTIFYWGILDSANLAVGLLITTSWTLGPFALLYPLLIRPVVVRLARFPEFSPADPGPRHLCRRFFWGASPHPDSLIDDAARVNSRHNPT